MCKPGEGTQVVPTHYIIPQSAICSHVCYLDCLPGPNPAAIPGHEWFWFALLDKPCASNSVSVR